MHDKPKVTVTFRIRPNLARRLDDLAARDGTTRTAIVEDAIEEHIAVRENAEPINSASNLLEHPVLKRIRYAGNQTWQAHFLAGYEAAKRGDKPEDLIVPPTDLGAGQ